MARPREFDRDYALRQAMRTFWDKGFAGTSTDDLVQAMGVGRQSLYNTFGDKRSLYMEALDRYGQETAAEHLFRLGEPVSALEGIRRLLLGLIVEEDKQRGLGCMGVGAICEFGTSDSELYQLISKSAPRITAALVDRVREGQATGEIDPDLDPIETAGFLQVTMAGMRVAARGGAGVGDLRTVAEFAVQRLATF